MSRPRIVTALVALSAPTILAASMSAGSASAADQARITVSSHQVRVGQVIEFTATGLDTHGGYYVMLCQNQPAVLPVCARPREVPDSFRHISNESTTALPIRPDGTATGSCGSPPTTSVFGPLQRHPCQLRVRRVLDRPRRRPLACEGAGRNAAGRRRRDAGHPTLSSAR